MSEQHDQVAAARGDGETGSGGGAQQGQSSSLGRLHWTSAGGLSMAARLALLAAGWARHGESDPIVAARKGSPDMYSSALEMSSPQMPRIGPGPPVPPVGRLGVGAA